MAHFKNLSVEKIEKRCVLHKVKPEDMQRSSDRTVEEALRAGRWAQYRHYDLIPDESGRRYVYAPSAVGGKPNAVNYLSPLARRSADQFLEFARWVEDPGMDRDLDTERNAEAAQGWAETFGVLGLNRTDVAIGDTTGSDAMTADYLGISGYPTTVRWRSRNSGQGGRPNESVERFAFEAWEAHLRLRLYEALLDDDLDTIVGFMSTRERGEPEITGLSRIEKEIHGSTPEHARAWAWAIIEQTIQRHVDGTCYPTLQEQASLYQQGWGFKSLLGAMWLQMLWLVADEVRRCDWCRRVIALENELETASSGRPSGRRKTRSNRRFCPSRGGIKDKCKADWNYHSGTGKSSKAARKGERERQRG
jgi:hypothetical protein